MNVAQESQCLKHLILTDVSLQGRSFEHLLLDDEQLTRFREFVEASIDAGPQELNKCGLTCPFFDVQLDCRAPPFLW